MVAAARFRLVTEGDGFKRRRGVGQPRKGPMPAGAHDAQDIALAIRELEVVREMLIASDSIAAHERQGMRDATRSKLVLARRLIANVLFERARSER